MDSIKFGDFEFTKYDYLSTVQLSHTTGGYYGCDDEYDLDTLELKEIVEYLNKQIAQLTNKL